MSTDTPETDKAHSDVIHGGSRFSFPEHARRMERERDTARRELAREREAHGSRTDEPNPNGSTCARLNWWMAASARITAERECREAAITALSHGALCRCKTKPDSALCRYCRDRQEAFALAATLP